MNTTIKKKHIPLLIPLLKLFTLMTIALLTATNGYAAGVGFVNISIVMQKAPQSISAVQRLESEFDRKDAQLLELEDDIRKGEILLRRSSREMDDDKRERLQSRIITMKRELKERREEFREEFNKRRTEEQSKIQQQVLEIIQDIAKSKNYDIVVSEPILYADDQVNLTEQVLDILEKRAK